MPDWDNTPPQALPAAGAQTGANPAVLPAAGAATGAAPGAIAAAAAQSNVAPPALPAAAAATGVEPGTLGADGAPTDSPAFAIDSEPASLPLPTMPSTFTPGFVELTGGGNSLSTLTASASDVAAHRIIQGTVAGQLKSYQVRAGNDAQDLPGIVWPANHDPVNNAVIFVQL